MSADLAGEDVTRFLASVHPYDTLPADELARTADRFEARDYARGDTIYTAGETLLGLFLIQSGAVEIRDRLGAQVSLLGTRNSFGERGLGRDGIAVTSASAVEDSRILVLPPDAFRELVATHGSFARFFDRSAREEKRPPSLATATVATLLTGDPISCTSDTPIIDAARLMRDRNISCLPVVDGGALKGIMTTTDLSHRVVAEGLDSIRPVAAVMTPDPITLEPSSLASDVLNIMHERRIGHLPIVEGGVLRGMVTTTDLTRLQAVTSAQFVADIAHAQDIDALARATAQIPQLLVSLVGAGNRHDVVTRLITDIADAATRRLLRLAEERLGPPPVPYLWLACGSQGRREQTGVSDQDNCLILDDAARPEHDAYFADLARFVSDGLDACGYYFCPGEMMATSPRWRQPLATWRRYFTGWIQRPDPEAQMLASVMFDLRPIGGDDALFAGLQAETLRAAAANSIFVAHMIANALKHTPPLSLFRGFATVRSGEHKDTLDLKMNGVAPVVDLGRIYALQGRLTPANTRARLEGALAAGLVSPSGGRDLLDAYDLIAETRLRHQAEQVRGGARPDNFMAPARLSDLERSHLRDAFVVVKTMQSALGHSRAVVS